MITKPSVEELLEEATNRYELVVAISKRTRQIVAGDMPKIENKETSKLTISSLEFAQDKYRILRETEDISKK